MGYVIVANQNIKHGTIQCGSGIPQGEIFGFNLLVGQWLYLGDASKESEKPFFSGFLTSRLNPQIAISQTLLNALASL